MGGRGRSYKDVTAPGNNMFFFWMPPLGIAYSNHGNPSELRNVPEVRGTVYLLRV